MKNAGKECEKETTDMKELQELVTAFENFKRDFRAEMRELKDSVSFSTDVSTEVKNTADEIKQLRQEIQEMFRQNQELKAEKKTLSAQM